MRVLLLQSGGGSWRQADIPDEAFTPEFCKKHGFPDTPFKMVRFHNGQFESFNAFNKDYSPEWWPIADVMINGGLGPWVENCQRVSDIETKQLIELLNRKRD